MSKRPIVIAAALAATCVAVIYFLRIQLFGLHGVVLTHGSSAPIAGAQVILDCQIATLHGYRTRRTHATTTGRDGGYQFSKAEVSGCDHLLVSASRAGYLDSWDQELTFAMLDRPIDPDPERIWLVDERDAVRLNLEGLLFVSNLENSSTIPDDRYTTIAIPFNKSKQVAKTRQDFDWIRRNYCDRVKQHWDQTPEQVQTKLMQRGDVGDYENDVVKFCAVTDHSGIAARPESD